MHTINQAVTAKGTFATFKRIGHIATRYGLTSAKIDHALTRFARLLEQFNASATFPITTVALKRHHATIAKYLGRNIEFAVHGYTHIDYTRLPLLEQVDCLKHARQIFQDMGFDTAGFRSPYLSRNADLAAALIIAGFEYVSNQPILWDMPDELINNAGYARAVAFYEPWSSKERLATPHLEGSLIEVPVSLPDDEILIDRLGDGRDGSIERTWLSILDQSYQRGELFTLQLHPERIAHCEQGLSAVLKQAGSRQPNVWLARLSELATWWRERSAAIVNVQAINHQHFSISITGPEALTVLVRGLIVDVPTTAWADNYQQVKSTSFIVQSPVRPIIGVSPNTPSKLIDLLREQGYIVEHGTNDQAYALYFARSHYSDRQEFDLCAEIEKSDRPLIKLGRWPNGAKSALAVTGDIDALTLWDYGLRFFGR